VAAPPAVEATATPAPEAEAAQAEVIAEAEPVPAPEPKPGVLKDLVADLESSLGDSFLPETVAHEVAPIPVPPAPAPSPAPAPVVAHAAAPVAKAEVAAKGEDSAPALGKFVADLETSLGTNFPQAAPLAEPPAPKPAPAQWPTLATAAPASAPAPAQAAAAAASAGSAASAPQVSASLAPAVTPAAQPPKPHVPPVLPGAHPPAAKPSPVAEAAGVDLAEMFGELKQDLESGVAASDEDPETHYNLGIAFREMGLLDEAIGELQKTCQAVDRGHPFPQLMQTYTWLAQCFLDKGVPEASIRWFEKALAVKSIDEDTRIALHYELATAHEAAGDKPAALKNFMEVYGRNIDHRDVAERIKALKS
jgi:tetratricopeptide (TPR) repeat protein